jgi:hypothetical protein
VLREVRAFQPTVVAAESDAMCKDLSGKLRRYRGAACSKRIRGRSKTVDETQYLLRNLENDEDVVFSVDKDEEYELL